jgi:hypothetical protein
MTHFEPEPKILEVYDNHKEKLLGQLSDEDLLLELRRRKRLAHLQVEYIVEGWRRVMGDAAPKEYILPQLMKQIAHEIGVNLSTEHTKIPGMKIEEGHFEIPGMPRMREYHTKDLRYFIPFNFVVEKP